MKAKEIKDHVRQAQEAEEKDQRTNPRGPVSFAVIMSSRIWSSTIAVRGKKQEF